MNTQVAVRDNELESERTAPAVFQPPRLPFHPEIENRFGISRGTWKVLTDTIFPTANDPSSIIMALSYCQARKLDVMKKPVHIVPVKQKRTKPDGKSEWVDVDTIWPSIAELRTTAMRTGEYAGKDPTAFGPTIEQTFKGSVREWEDGPNGKRQQVTREKEITLRFPEWAEVTDYRMIKGVRCAFVGPKVFWLEQYATQGRWSDLPNEMWSDRAFGQVDKCGEAAALRCAFPEEIGNQYAAEEMEGRRMLAEVAEAGRDVSPPRIAATSGPPRRVSDNGNGSTGTPSKVVDSPSTSPADDGKAIDGEVLSPAASSGPPRRAPEQKQAASQEKPQQQAGGMPDPQNAQAFLMWVEEKLGAIDDPELMAQVWAEEISESLTSDTYESAAALFKKYQNALNK